MSKQLSTDDRRAIDLVLDRAGSGSGFAAPGSVQPVRTAAVEKVLTVLSVMPAVEPPTDLVSRTLRRIAESPAAVRPGENVMGLPLDQRMA